MMVEQSQTIYSPLLNLFLDDAILTSHQKDFVETDQNNGIFLIEINADVMQRLASGDHTIKLQLTGPGDVTGTILVK